VIHHIAERLHDLHAAGYCHRDLKPGNVMWLPRKNRWTLIDFGCASKLGEEARIAYSLAYAAPEVIHAVREGRNTIMASDKLDAWSLGVMAVELLTNKPPFNLLEGKDKVEELNLNTPGSAVLYRIEQYVTYWFEYVLCARFILAGYVRTNFAFHHLSGIF
jgi:serine/threonine protein kinase